MHRIGRQVHVGADAQELGRLFKHDGIMAHHAKTDRRGQPTDAAAANADFEFCHGRSSSGYLLRRFYARRRRESIAPGFANPRGP